MRQPAALLVLTMLLDGCYSWTTIKTTELPKLNAASTSTGSDARVYLREKKPLTFNHPVLSTIESDGLASRSSNHPEVKIPLESIQRVEVSQFERGQSAIVGSLLGMALGALAAVLIVESTR